jgi:CheY-like chemotaxis protein
MEPWPDVLIVDDEKGLRFFASEIFRLEGIAAKTLSDGCQAVDYLNDVVKQGGKMPRVVILDVNMPCMNGLQVYEKIAAEPWIKDMVVVLTSASRNDIDYPDAGSVRILFKPYDVLALVDLVRGIAPDLFNQATT